MTIDPGLAVTVYGSLTPSADRLRAINPAIVIRHQPASQPDVDALRAILPTARLWVQVAANFLAAPTLPADAACDRVRALVRGAVAVGAEVFSLNGEEVSHPGGEGWNARDGLPMASLRDRCQRILDAAHEEAAGRLVLGWSSHDCPEWHHLPWGAIFGPDSPVALNLAQVYPDRPGAVVGHQEALHRHATMAGQWAQLVAAGAVRADLAPGGAGWVEYVQGAGLAVDGACALFNTSPLAAIWTAPGELDDLGVTAARADQQLRASVGHAAGRVERWQTAHGMVVDGIVGPRTLAALVPSPAAPSAR